MKKKKILEQFMKAYTNIYYYYCNFLKFGQYSGVYMTAVKKKKKKTVLQSEAKHLFERPKLDAYNRTYIQETSRKAP